MSELANLSKYGFDTNEVKIIASILGWPGCYGFNRLLHHHTAYPLKSVFKDHHDMSYSQRIYITGGQWFGTFTKTCSFCPECVRVDLRKLGYSYWRRSYQTDIAVCAKHNVMLIDSCPFCDKPFSRGGHSLDVMWKGCSASHLGEVAAVENHDPEALKKAQFFEAIFTFDFHISIETAICVLFERFLLMTSQHPELVTEYENHMEWLRKCSARMDKDRLENNGRSLNYQVDDVIDKVIFAFNTFDEFANAAKSYEDVSRPVDSLWSTYESGGSESVNYIEENYIFGVGIWSCPHPSPISLDPFSNDGYSFRRPVIYTCCNFAHPRSRWPQLKSRNASYPFPLIPVVDGIEHLIMRDPSGLVVQVQKRSRKLTQ